jgi:hypothetical protein
MSDMKVFTYSVRATEEQRERWEAAAVAHGRMTVGSFLAQATDTYLEKMAKSGRRLPLAWTWGEFQARIYDRLVWPWQYREIDVSGWISGRFGIYRGDGTGQETHNNHVFSLVHIPSRRIIVTLTYKRDCQAFAAELVYLWINWDQEDPEKVVQGSPDQPRAAALFQKYKGADRR